MKKITLLVFVLFGFISNAQTLLSENFDTALNWVVAHPTGTNANAGWTRVTTGTSPTVTPTGAGMARFNSFSISGSGLDSYSLTSPAISFGTENYRVRFNMYRDNGYLTNADKVDVIYNTTQSSAGGTILGTINRSINLTPIVSGNGFVTYAFNIPAAAASSDGYISFLGTSFYGNNIFIDEVVVEVIPTGPPTCVAITTPANGAVNVASSTLVWNSNIDATDYKLSVGTTPNGTDILNLFSVGNVTSYNLATEPGITYYVKVFPSNANGIATGCNESSFTTCAGNTSFSENFDTNTTGTTSPMPTCWTRTGTTGSTYVTTGGVAPGSAPNRLYMFSSGTTPTVAYANTPLVSNLSAATHRLKFKAYATTAGRTIDIGYLTTPGDPSTFTLIQTITLNTTTAATAVEFFVIPTGIITDTTNLSFKLANTVSGQTSTVYIDDVAWEEIPAVVPSCSATVTATPNATCGNFSNTINWSAVAGSDGYILTIGTTSGGTDILNNVNQGSLLSYSFVGNPATTYYYKVVPFNAVGPATGCAEQNFTTFSSGCYCNPVYTTGKTSGDLISNIVIAGTTLSNNTGTDPVNPAYTYFTGQPNYTADLQAGSSYNITVSVGTFGSQNVAVWIDYNDNFTFEPNERVGFTTTSIAANGSATFSITLACNPALGTHRMRVRDVWLTAGNTIDPCASYGYGETEDYDVTVSAAVACPQPSNLIATNITSTSATIGWVTGCAELSWNLYVVAAGSSAPTGTPTYVTQVNPFVISGLQPGTPYDVYIAADCTTNGVSLLTGPFTFTTTPNPPANDECSGAIALTVNTDLNCASQTAGTVNAATASSTDATACFGTENDDVWFSFVATQASHRIQLNDVSNFTDMFHSVWTGDCSALTLVPNSCSDADTSNPSGLVAGQTYYVRVNTYGGTASTATFNICVGTPPPPPANDECAGAIALTLDDTFCDGVNNNGSNESATNSGVALASCFNYGLNDVWFSIVVPAGVATINVSTDFTGGTLVDTEVALYSGACGTLTEIACDQDGGTTTLSNGSSYNSLITNAAVTAGQTYYVRVSGYSAAAVGTFCLRASTNTLGTTAFDSSTFSYYPNPVKDVLNLSYIQTISKVQVNNLLGQVVLAKTINANESQIDMSSLPAGTYLVSVTAEGLTKTIKIVKE